MIKSAGKDIDKIVADIDIDGPLGLSDPANILTDDELTYVRDIFTIISRYKENKLSDIDVEVIKNDIIQLQSLQVFLSHTTSRLSAYAQSYEEELKTARAKARNQARKLQTSTLKLTVEDIKDAAQLATEDLRNQLENYRQSAEFCKFIYYTVKDHITYLDRTVTRAYRIPE